MSVYDRYVSGYLPSSEELAWLRSHVDGDGYGFSRPGRRGGERLAEVLLCRAHGQAERPQTLKSIGSALGITVERVRQLEAKALRALRQHAGDLLRERGICPCCEGSGHVRPWPARP